MWPFKKKLMETVPYPIAVTIPVGCDQFFNVNDATIVFAIAHDYTTGAYGGSLSSGRCQDIVYKTCKGNYVLVTQDIALWPNEMLTGDVILEKTLKKIYHAAMQEVELNTHHPVILVDTLQYKRSEV